MANTTSGGNSGVNRRGFLYAAGATAIGVAGWEAGRRFDTAGGVRADATAVAHHRHAAVDTGAFRYPQGDPAYGQRGGRGPQSVHKSAARMSRQEIRRFSRAYTWAVAKGYFDVFNDQHYNAMRNRHHLGDVQATAPPTVAAGEGFAWGLRLLPWHRSFITEAEAMLRAALAERNRRERRDPAEADLLFLPYWDATHDRDLPGWVKRLRPRGGTAIVPPGLPPGHVAFGKPVGSRYRIDFGRWPATMQGFRQLPPVDQIGRILSHDTFVDFYLPIDVVPEIVEERVPAALQALAALAQRLPDDPNVQLLVAFIETPPPAEDFEAQLAAFNAMLAVGHLADLEAAKPRPDRELIRLILTVRSVSCSHPISYCTFGRGASSPATPTYAARWSTSTSFAWTRCSGCCTASWTASGTPGRPPTPTRHSSRVQTGCSSRCVAGRAAGTAAGAPTPSTSSSITKQWPTPTTGSTPCEGPRRLEAEPSVGP
jgi:hypothetical protein